MSDLPVINGEEVDLRGRVDYGSRFIWKREELDELRNRGIICGENVAIHREAWLDSFGQIIIGDNVVITADVIIQTHDAAPMIWGLDDDFQDVKIGNQVFIGKRAIVLRGVEIGDNCVIGANAVVTDDIEPGTVAAGVPAREIMTIEEYLEKHVEGDK